MASVIEPHSEALAIEYPSKPGKVKDVQEGDLVVTIKEEDADL